MEPSEQGKEGNKQGQIVGNVLNEVGRQEKILV